MKRRFLALFMICFMLCGLFPTNIYAATPNTNFKVGEYVKFGSYNKKPVIWKVINLDKEGNPLLFSDQVLSFKSYDARGASYESGDDKASGKNDWQFSTIRQWLNSSEKSVPWINNAPSAENVFFNGKPYDKEAGFLADGNFTQLERAMIKSVNHKVLLDRREESRKDGGVIDTTTLYLQSQGMDNFKKSYDTADYMNITDGMFLLSIKELNDYVTKGGSFDSVTATAEALKSSAYKGSATDYYDYWLRTPINLFVVSSSGGSFEPYFIQGIRPAFYLNKSLIESRSGSGTKKSPYTVKCDAKKVEARYFSTYKIGDYVQFGSYNSSPILWRVINLDANGNLLLFSENILSIKAFDTKGDFHKDPLRKAEGSNEWENSNIRQWLNSDESSIKWLQNPPISEKISVWDGKDTTTYLTPDAYDLEKGFLADGNFSQSERTLIKPVTQKAILSEFDSSKKDGGTGIHTFNSHPGSSALSYEKAYYKNITDKVFLLSFPELKEYVYGNGLEYRGKLTSEAIKNSNPMFDDNMKEQYWPYFLRTPYPEENSKVLSVSSRDISYSSATSDTGVRPALYVDASAKAASGNGSKTSPYIIK